MTPTSTMPPDLRCPPPIRPTADTGRPRNVPSRAIHCPNATVPALPVLPSIGRLQERRSRPAASLSCRNRRRETGSCRLAPTQMPVDRFVRHLSEGLVGTGAALDPRLAAEARHPLVGADPRIAHLTRLGVFPALRMDILAAAKQEPEQRNLLAGRRQAGDRRGRRRPMLRAGTVARDFGETGLQGRLFGPELRKPFADEGRFPAIGCCITSKRSMSPQRVPAASPFGRLPAWVARHGTRRGYSSLNMARIVPMVMNMRSGRS